MDPRSDPVRAEIERIEEAIRILAAGKLSPAEFRRVRVVQGIYPIRGGTDRYLLRIRVPLGRIAPGALRAVAEAADRFSGGRAVHLTTRQDFHLYGVRRESLPAALAFLADAGLTTREACGDTVRNILVCPFAGISPEDLFDPSPFAEALGAHLLRNPLGQNLPRKFKIAFEGCAGTDHVGLFTHDVGIRAVLSREGRPGFRITLAGGLGARPRAGFELEPFTGPKDLVSTVEAVLRLFDREGDRERRGAARFKFVAQRLGERDFREAVLAERDRIARASSTDPLRMPDPTPGPDRKVRSGRPLPSWPGSFLQRQAGKIALPVRFPAGDLTPAQLRGLASLAEGRGASIRLTPDQGLLLADLPEERAEDLSGTLRSLGGTSPASVGITRCAGTETCTVGTTRARALMSLLEREVLPRVGNGGGSPPAVSIGISGCANGCGRHLLADIGLQGVSRTVPGNGKPDRAAPHYLLFLGGGTAGEGPVRFGTPLGRVPVRRVPEAILRILAVCRERKRNGETPGETISRVGPAPFTDALAALLDPPGETLAEEDFFDLGPDAPVPFPPDRTGPKAP
ncbi:MAG: nitrite/sulfite reductase [Deltaproteobacteria bacterium]